MFLSDDRPGPAASLTRKNRKPVASGYGGELFAWPAICLVFFRSMPIYEEVFYGTAPSGPAPRRESVAVNSPKQPVYREGNASAGGRPCRTAAPPGMTSRKVNLFNGLPASWPVIRRRRPRRMDMTGRNATSEIGNKLSDYGHPHLFSPVKT